MTTHAAQHALPLPRVAPMRTLRCWRPEIGAGLGLLAVWIAAWVFLLAGVAAPAGRLHAQATPPDRAGPGALARATLPPPPGNQAHP
jgi:hypothetical protein